MEAFGHIQNGVVVFDEPPVLPEGSRVVVQPVPGPDAAAAEGERIEFPLVRSASKQSWNLTNEQIAEILEEEEAESVKGLPN